ncbi:MAG: DoxX family protein [Actinobacteria bacterium]|jgi:putative oxidoreductase|nr:DoxX family protein [Actinomycetota bacterium]
MNAIVLIGRILFGGFFLMSGINHFTKLEAMTGYAKYKKLPAAKLGVLISGLMLVIGGIYIVLGYYADLGALLLAIFLVLAAVIFHNFWKETDATAKQTEMMAFMKDIALAGGALVIFAMVAKQGGEIDFGWVISKAHIALWK